MATTMQKLNAYTAGQKITDRSLASLLAFGLCGESDGLLFVVSYLESLTAEAGALVVAFAETNDGSNPVLESLLRAHYHRTEVAAELVRRVLNEETKDTK